MGGGRKRRKKVSGGETSGWIPPVDALTKSIGVHPSGSHVVVSSGSRITGFDFSKQEVFQVGDVSGPIRVVAFSPCGRWLLAGGDDKCFRVWEVESWDSCKNTFEIHKKVSSGAFTTDGRYCVVGDKFGDVHCGLVDPTTAQPSCSVLLGHYCSTITSISISQSSNAVVTTDRDNKVRCSTLPPNPLEGSYEIKAYCLGHNAFVTSSSFAVWDKREVLVTGGGDGQVIVWNYETGQALAKYQVPKVEHNKSSNGSDEVPGEYCEENTTEQEGLNLKQEQSSNLRVKGESQMESGNVILSLSTAPTQPYIALVFEGCGDIWILECHAPTYDISLMEKLASPHVPNPAKVLFDSNEQLWLVGGPVTVDSNEIHIAIAKSDGERTFAFCSHDVIPEASLLKLECRSESMAGVGKTVNIASVSQTLGKREYLNIENRKKSRADMKEKYILEGSNHNEDSE